jgi:adenylate cyclase
LCAAAAVPAARRPAIRPASYGNLLFSQKNIGDTILSVDEPLKTRIEELVRAGTVRRKLAAAQLEAEIRRREEVLRRTFRRYLSPRLADKILEDAQLRDTLLSTQDLRAHAVVLFADLRGFTTISERLEPGQVVPLLNEYFSLLTEITFRHDGTVFHMAGDCLMLGFGVPLEQSDSPGRAVRAAREMLESFKALAHSWRERYGVDAGLGIGINEGDVVAGNIGSTSYMSYTLVGDTVNVAARLCQRARAGEMLFSRTVKQSLDALGLDIGATPLPPMQVRGRSGSIDIFCVPVEERLQVTEVPVAI